MLLFLTTIMAAVTSVQTSNIDSWRLHEIGKLRKWGIGQESINGLAKTQMRRQVKEGNLDKWRL